MDLFTRLGNGWKVAKLSMQVLNAHKSLIVFPIFSGMSLALIVASFFYVFNYSSLTNLSTAAIYAIIFLFYIIGYFIIVFFNMGLIHCARLHFEGREVFVGAGLAFSSTRVGAIFSWAVFSATVGVLLKMLQDNLGWLGRIATSFVGFAWSVATFFVIPVIAYENVGPSDAIKRSTDIVKQKWGEALGANFSLGIVFFLVVVSVGILGAGVSSLVNEQAGIVVFVAGMFIAMAVSSALQSIFVSALYHHLNGGNNQYLRGQGIDDLFTVE